MRNVHVSLNSLLRSSIILSCIGWMLFYSLTVAIDIPTFHLDGAFQTASGLFRLNSGQFPGKDFFPYLGIGPIAILFPTFKIFGADLSASVISAQFVTLIAGALSAALIFHLICRPKSFSISITIGVIFFVTPLAAATLFSLQLPAWISFSISPGNSLRPIRALAPYLLAMAYYFLILKIKNERIRYVLCGTLTASIFLWSNDYAIPSAGLFTLFVSLHLASNHKLNLRNLCTYLFVVSVSWIALLSLATHGNPVALIKYNFLDVAKDQWWFFGPYGETTRVFTIQQVGRLFSEQNQFSLVVLALIGILAINTRYIEYALVFWIGLVLFSGGVVASVGGHLGDYFGAFYFWAWVTLACALANFALFATNKLFRQRKFEKIILQIVLFVFFIVSALGALNSWSNYKSSLSNAKNDLNRFYVPELGGYLNKQWSGYISLIRSTESDQVIEEYWGLWSATRKIISAWPVDSVISALGSTREIAKNKLNDAYLLISTRYTTATEWQPWNLSQNYWFYEELIKNWTPHDLSPTTVVWLKDSHPKDEFKNIGCNLDKKQKRLVLNAPSVGFYALKIMYSLAGDGRFILMVKNNISFGADANGYVSLDPKGRVAKFPVYISQAGLSPLDIKVTGASVFDLELLGCEAHQIPITNSNVLHVPGTVNENFFVTDVNWEHGIARNWAGFFVPSTEKFSGIYKLGKQVRFPDGNVRRIIRVERYGEYLNVYIDGDPLSPEKVGLPSTFIVINNTDSTSKVGGK